MLTVKRSLMAGALVTFVAAASAGSAQAALKSASAAGYQVHGRRHQQFRFVSATWTVPHVKCVGPVASGGEDGGWVSFVSLASGPFTGGDLNVGGSEQVGVETVCAGILSNTVAFIEMGGTAETQTSVSPGDTVTASILYRAGKYRFSIHDRQDARSSFSMWIACGTEPYGNPDCGRGSAEVGAGAGLNPALARFGSVTFSHIRLADANGRRGSLAPNRFWTATKYNEYRPSRWLEVASPLAFRGTRFTARWRHF